MNLLRTRRLVPVVMLQKLAITASWWILAITISEMLLNPIVYYYLKAPEPELVILRERGGFRKLINRFVSRLLTPTGMAVTVIAWLLATGVAVYFVRGLTIGDPTSASPLLFLDSPYNVSHKKIQDKFGGVEPLIIVAEGYDRDAMKEPKMLRRMEEFQRVMERYWCLRWLVQEQVVRVPATVLRESLVKLGPIPLLARVPSLPESETGMRVEVEVSNIDLLGLDLDCRFVGRL